MSPASLGIVRRGPNSRYMHTLLINVRVCACV